MDSDFFALTPFPVKPDMTLATLPRPPLKDSAQFEAALSSQDGSLSKPYLEECKRKPKIKRAQEKGSETCNTHEEECMEVEDDVIISSPDAIEQNSRPSNIRYKLLQFHTNHRPAYFGSWRKRSKLVTPRNPFKKDEV